jgi:basic amino acid/polyamine antiporter, APA family
MAKEKLTRTLGLVECIFFGTGSILGAGIYAIVGKVAGIGGGATWVCFAIASLTALMSAFSYAELSSMIPKAGAEYYYAKAAFNRKRAVVLGLIVSFTGAISGATVSLAFAGYLSELLLVPQFLSAAGIIGLVWVVNSIGIRQSSWVNIVFTVIEFGGLILVLWAAAPYFETAKIVEIPTGGVNALLIGAALSYFAFLGFEEIVKLSEETKNPQRNIPRALFVSSGIVIVLYLLVSMAVVCVVPPSELGQSEHPLADVVEKGIGVTAAVALSVIALFSTTNTILSNMIGSSRVLLELGEEHRTLRKLAYVSPKRKAPLAGLLVAAVFMVGFAAIGNLETVALVANFFIFIVFLTVNVAVIVLRYKQPNATRPFRIPLNIGPLPVPSVLGILMTLLLLVYSVYYLATAGAGG